MTKNANQVYEKIEVFFRQYPTKTYPKNELLIVAGSQNSDFYYIETGVVKMSLVSTEGKNLILHLFFPKSFFSLLSLASEGMNNYDFITLRQTTLRKIPRKELVDFLTNNSDVLSVVQTRLLKGMEGLLKRIEICSLSSAYKQVASLICYFGRHFIDPEQTTHNKRLTIKITHQEIADWLGLSRENVSIQMKLLEKNGVITTHRHLIEITNPDELLKSM